MVNSVTTKLAELNLEDRFLFDETMENKEAYQAAVSMDLQKTVYHTEMQKKDTGNLKKRSRYYRRLEDGAVKIFINTQGTNKEEFSQEFLDFMEYITASTDAVAKRSASRRIKLIHEHVRKIKASEKMGVKYMQLWEEKVLIREEGRSEGIEKGRAEILVKSVETVMKNFGIDLQKACEGVGTTVEEYHRAKEGR